MRLLIATFGVALAAAAFLALAGERSERPVVPDPPLDEIDDASRARLERVLRESGGAED